jgi:hypothetical protein
MAESKSGRCRGNVSAEGLIWAIGWLFTIGYLHLHVWKGLLAIIIWPYYLGTALVPK